MTRSWLLGAIVIAGLAVVTSCVCEPCDEGMRNKELVAEAFAVVEAGEFDKLDQFIAADYVRHCQASPDIEVTSLEDFKEFLNRDRETVSDPKIVLHRLIAEDDLTADKLAGVMRPLLTDRARLEDMADRARTRARPNAMDAIVSACVAAAGLEASS